MNDDYTDREKDIISYFQSREKDMQEHIRHLERRLDYEYSSDEKILERMDLKTIEQFIRRKKLKNITDEHINN